MHDLHRLDFRRPSLILTAVLMMLTGCRQEPSVDPINAPASSGPVWFKDATASWGLRFIHDAGAQGHYFMPEQAGSGAALLDYDNDGRLDIYLVQCGGPESQARNQLFHQEPDGSFRNVSEGSGVDVAGWGMGATAGDVNNDGHIDLLVTEYGAARLFLNSGQGAFGEITGECGIDNSRWATAASFFDYDRDGWLDLVVANYLDYNPTHKCFDSTGQPEYCGPQNFSGTVTRLFHNRGSADAPPRFEDVTVAAGLTTALGPGLGVLCADFNGDRWPDIFVADDGMPNRLFINRKNGTFQEEAALRGLAYNNMGSSAGNMGIAIGDINEDGFFDLFVTHLAEEQHSLWTQGPRGLFQDSIAAHGLVNPAWRGTGFGTVLADFDHDTWPDLAFVNGLVQRGGDTSTPRLAGLDPHWHPYAQRSQVFRNLGHGQFADLSIANPEFSANAIVGRGLACGDLNNDGAPDLLVTSTGGPAQLFLNIATQRGHWLQVRVVDPSLGGRDAVGAEVEVRIGTRTLWRLAQPSYSYLVSNDPRLHFGLGTRGQFDAIHVLWPDGTEESFDGGDADRLLRLEKGTGRTP